MLPIIPEARAGYRYLEVARNQPEYIPLPTIQNQRNCRTEWQLSWRERLYVLLTGRIKIMFMTFGRPMYPVKAWCLGEDDPDSPLPNPLKDAERDNSNAGENAA